MASSASAPSKPPSGTWLILGGCGFIGRNLLKYLLDNSLAAAVRVADKRAPFMAFLGAEYKAALASPLVEFVQVDMADDEMAERAFAPPRDGAGGGAWDYVVNLVAETGLGKKEEFYEKGVAAAAKAADAALRAGGTVRKFVHLSTASVYKGAASAAGTAEDGRVEPWTVVAAAAARAEEALRGVSGLPLVVLRPATVYGPGDHAGLMARCVIAATYKASADRMDFLWDASVKVATVHVFDVVRAIYFCARKAEPGSGASRLAGRTQREHAAPISEAEGAVRSAPTQSAHPLPPLPHRQSLISRTRTTRTRASSPRLSLPFLASRRALWARSRATSRR
jgi:nucleoside-diphosphate-sugar epimerase